MIFRFDKFELDTDRFELRRSGDVIRAEPQTVQVLRYLIENRNRMVSRHDLLRNIWKGRAISDWAVSAAIKSVRKVLGDTASPRRFIATIHGRGFRFIADVDVLGNTPDPVLKIVTDATADAVSLAVIPLNDLSSSQDRQYFADGISEDLITDLTKVPGLSVAGRNSSFRFRNHEMSASSLGSELTVNYILEGSVRRQSDRLRINVQLTDTQSGEQLWAERFEGEENDIFALQDDVCGRIVRSLKLYLALGSNRRGTRNPRAYDLCLRGRSEYYQYTPANLAKALTYFEEATAIDPEYAEAYAYQAYCRNSMYVFAWPGSDSDLQPAINLARKAISLDGNSGIAHARLGWSLGFTARPDEAIASFETAVELAPETAEIWYSFGETLNRLAMPKRALPVLDRAFSIDSFVPPAWDFARGHSRVLLRQYDKALDHILPVLERVPGFIPARVQLARIYAEMGRNDQARETVSSIRELAPRYRLQNAQRMFPYPEQSERDRLEAGLRQAGLPE